jgi:hypothetical protein
MVKQDLMSSVGIFCLCALALLLVFATCSALTFPRRKLSQAVFETFGVLCVTLLLVVGTWRSIRPETFFPRRTKPQPEELLQPLEWWERTLPPRGIDDLPRKRLPA